MKGSELIAAAKAAAAAATPKTNKYVPPALRKAEAAKPKPLDLTDRSLFPTLGLAPVVATDAEPKTPVFKQIIERRIQEDKEEEMRGKRAKNLDTQTMTRAQLEEAGFEVLRLPNLKDPVKRLAFTEQLALHRLELEQRQLKVEEGMYVYGQHEGFRFSSPLVPHDVVEEWAPVALQKPVWAPSRPELSDDEGFYSESDDE
jgi:hypothetical protein